MIKPLALSALLGTGGCLFDDGVPLSDLTRLTITVDIDVGAVVDEFVSQGDELYASLEDETAGCFRIERSAMLSLDGVEAGYITRGGPYTDENHGNTETGCDSPGFIVHDRPSPRDVSVIQLSDSSVTKRLVIENFLVNPPMTVAAPLRSGMPAVIRVVDSRPLAKARMSWHADVVTGTNQWTVDGDVSTPGEIRFTVPSYTGRGTLHVDVTITDHQMDCSDFAACKVSVRGGARIPMTIAN